MNDYIDPDVVGKTNAIEISRHLKRYIFALDSIPLGCIVLDAGCGTGYGSRILSFKADWVIGVDHNANALQIAQQKFSAPNIVYLAADIADITPELLRSAVGQIEDEQKTQSQSQELRPDVIIAFEMLEHNDEPRKLLEHLWNLLQQDGMLIASLPVNSHAPGHKRIFHLTEAENTLQLPNAQFFYQQGTDVSATARQGANIVIVRAFKRG